MIKFPSYPESGVLLQEGSQPAVPGGTASDAVLSGQPELAVAAREADSIQREGSLAWPDGAIVPIRWLPPSVSMKK